MNKDELKNIIAECCNDVVFVYRGKRSGVTSEVHDYVPTFQVWHGDAVKEYSNVDDVMNDPFYNGKSIVDLINEIEFAFY